MSDVADIVSTEQYERMIAAEWAALSVTVAEERAQLEEHEGRLKEIEHELRARKGVGEAIATDGGVVVLAPPSRKLPARINMRGVEAAREELIGLGLVEETLTLSRPKVSTIREKWADLVARGVDPSVLLYEPQGEPELRFVPTAGEAA